MLVVGAEVGVPVSGAVGSAVGGVQARVRVVLLLLPGPLRRAAQVQDLGVVPFPGLALSQLPGFGLDPERSRTACQQLVPTAARLQNSQSRNGSSRGRFASKLVW